MHTTSDRVGLPTAALTPGPKVPSCGDGISGIPAYKARRKDGGLSVAIRFELSAHDSAAVLYARCLAEDPSSLSGREVCELAVLALAGPAHAMVRAAREE